MRLKEVCSFSFCFFLLLNSLVGQQPRLMLPVGHTAGISAVSIAPGGRQVLTASDDMTAKIWDIQTGKLLVDLKGHSDGLTSAIYSGDGKIVLTGSHDWTARTWDAKSGKPILVLKGHEDVVGDVAFSPDGHFILTNAYDSIARVWDAVTGATIAILKGSNVVFSPDGKTLALASADYELHLFSLQTRRIVKKMKGNNEPIRSINFSPDGRLICTASEDTMVQIWSSSTGKRIARWQAHSWDIRSAKFSPDGKGILTTGTDFLWHDKRTVSAIYSAKLWDAAGQSLLTNLIQEPVSFSDFSPTSRQIVTTTQYGLIARAWDLSGRELASLKGHTGYIQSVAFSSDGKQIITGSDDNTSILWDVNTGNIVQHFRGRVAKSTGVLSRDGTMIAISSGGKVVVNNIIKGNTYPLPAQKNHSIENVYFSYDGKQVIGAHTWDSVRVWDTESGQLLFDAKGRVNGIAGRSSKLLTILDNNTVQIWDTRTGKLLLTLKEKKISVVKDDLISAIFSPDESRVLTTSKDHTAKLWDARSGELLLDLKGHTDRVYKGSFSNDGAHIITVSRDGTARVWDTAAGKIQHVFSNDIVQAFYSPDGRIVTTNEENQTTIWDAATFKKTANLPNISFIAFSKNGKRMLTGSNDRLIRMISKNLNTPDFSIQVSKTAYFNDINFENERLLVNDNYEISSYDLKTGKKLYSYIAIDSANSIIVLPSGFYKATPGAAKNLYYLLDGIKVLTFEQLDVKYNRPDKVLEAIGSTDTALIRSYRKAYEKRIKKLRIDTTSFRDGYSVPEADFTNRDAIEYEQKSGILKLNIKGNDSTYILDRFYVWVNESPIFGQRGINIRRRSKNDFDTTITIKLSQGENRIETSITNVNGTESYRMPLVVNYTPAVKQKETIRFIGIGIDRFSDNEYNLQYSSKDIRDLSKKLKEKYKEDIIIDTLFNEDVTVNNVKALKQKLQQTTENDKVIIAYSGHGLLSKDYDYYLSTYAVNFNKPEENGLPYDELENLLDSIPARKKLMLIDACHSGEVDKEEGIAMNKMADSLGLTKGIIIDQPAQTNHLGLKNSFELMQSLFVNVGKSTGATIISAAAGNQFALERGDLKNGVFTFSLLEAMNKYSTIKISELKKIVGERVEQLTNGMQKPTSRNEVIAADWSIW